MASFALAHAAGTEWKSITEKCLAELSGREQRSDFDFLGLLYATDLLAGDAENILAHLRAKTGIANWVGSVGMGVCATGQEYFDQPAMAILIAELPKDSFRLLAPRNAPGKLPASTGMRRV